VINKEIKERYSPVSRDGNSTEERGKEEKCIDSKLPIGVDGAAWGTF